MKIKDETMNDLRAAFAQRKINREKAALAKPQIMVKHPKTGALMTKAAYQESLKPKVM